MKEEVTIVIPSHKRHHLLLRAIDYYSELDFLILIVDSSKVFLNVKLPWNITYVHLPGSFFGDKIYSGLCKVSTPYSCLCADDDFLAENGLKVGKEFLEENLDYVSVQGHYIQFDPLHPEEKYTPLYIAMHGFRNDSDIIKDRVLNVSTPNVYALHRTIVLKKAIQITLNQTNVTVVEPSIPMVAMCYGKHFVLPVFWAARDVVRYSKYLDENGDTYSDREGHLEIDKLNNVVSDLKDYLISPEGNKLRNNFVETVSDIVPDRREAEDLFDSVFIKLISLRKQKKGVSFIKKLKNVTKLFLPNVVVRKIQFYNYNKLRLAQKSVSGYPWSGDIAMKDWKSMTRVILKFRGLK